MAGLTTPLIDFSSPTWFALFGCRLNESQMRVEEQPLVSVLMPAHNASAFIEMAIASVLQQDYANWELLIAVDSSTDRTEHIVRDFASRDERIRLVASGAIGFPYVRSLLLNEANGVFVAILDADDICHPQRLCAQVKYLLAHPQVDIVGSFCATIDGDGTVIGRRTLPEDSSDIAQALMVRNPIIHSTVMFRASIRRFGLEYCGAPAEDYVLWLRLLLRGCRFAMLPQDLVQYRVHSSSLTQTDARTVALRLNALVCHQLESIEGPQTTARLERIMSASSLDLSVHHPRHHELNARWHRRMRRPQTLRQFWTGWRYALCPYFVMAQFADLRIMPRAIAHIDTRLWSMMVSVLRVIGHRVANIGWTLCPCGIESQRSVRSREVARSC